MSETTTIRALAILLTLTIGGATSADASSIPVGAERVAQPTIDEIFASCVEAAGGRRALDAVKTLHTEGTMTGQGMTADADMYWSRDGKRFVKLVTPFGEIKQGTDGKVYWMHHAASGYMLMDEEEGSQVDFLAGLHMIMLDPKDRFKEKAEKLEVVGTESFNGEECYKVYQLDKDGTEAHVYFGVDSGLPIGFRSIEEDGTPGDVTTIGDWKVVDGVNFFRTISIQSKDPRQGNSEIKISTIEINKTGDDVFALPEEVEKMAAAQADADENEDSGGAIKLSDLTPVQQEQAKQLLAGTRGAPAPQRQQVIAGLEANLALLPESERKMYEYVVQELKKMD